MMKHRARALLVLLSLALAGRAAAQPERVAPVEIKVGPAQVAGFVSFVLVASGSGDSLAVEAAIPHAPLGAAAKAALIAEAVAAADPSGAWAASGQGGTLTFQHRAGDTWQPVDVVSNYADTTGTGTRLGSALTAVSFTISFDESAVAVGRDAAGGPSHVTLAVTDTLVWTRALQGGETPQELLDALQAFLAAEGGEGVVVERAGPASLTVILRYAGSVAQWQVTDLALEPGSKGEARGFEVPGMLIRR